MKNTVLLLTGTVNSSGINFMKRDNSEVRLKDYLLAIRNWLDKCELNIVFVENSNFPKESIGDDIILNKKFEYITYNGQNFPRNKGKGFGEINSFEYAFANSRFLKDANFIVKCNGRYFFKGISKFENIDADIVGEFNLNLSFMDSRVFGFKQVFFTNYFLNYKSIIDDSKGIYFEHALAMATHELLSKNGKWSAIPFPLIIEGYSGTDNYKYNSFYSNIKKYIKFYLKKIIH